ncbi:MAG TPA: EI24 domain-containing protein [Kofleriaceae bacterium]|jgi:CysZ protein|nr:EI24 domain-containing protein [Kofleriaceae bacterium]
MFGELSAGVGDAFSGAGHLLRHPRLWIWVLLPAVIIAILLILLIGGLITWLSPFIAAVTHYLPGHFATRLVEILLGIILAIASFSVVFSLASLIAGPFNELLSEAIEEQLTGHPGPKFRVLDFLHDLLIGVIHSLRRIFIYLLSMGVLLLIGLVVPVVGTAIAAIGGWLATARFASYDAYDAIFSRRRMRYRAKLQYLNHNLWRTMGIGGVMAFMSIIPVLNLIALSIGAAGATLRMCAPRAAPQQAAQRQLATRS